MLPHRFTRSFWPYHQVRSLRCVVLILVNRFYYGPMLTARPVRRLRKVLPGMESPLLTCRFSLGIIKLRAKTLRPISKGFSVPALDHNRSIRLEVPVFFGKRTNQTDTHCFTRLAQALLEQQERQKRCILEWIAPTEMKSTWSRLLSGNSAA